MIHADIGMRITAYVADTGKRIHQVVSREEKPQSENHWRSSHTLLCGNWGESVTETGGFPSRTLGA